MNRQPYQTPPTWWAPRISQRWMDLMRPLSRRRGLWMHGLSGSEVRGMEHIQQAMAAGQSVLITPNHPTHADPFVMLDAADQLGRPFCYLTAWQVFAATHRLGRWALRRHGAFSINREGHDVRAMRQAIRILEQGDHPLVVFPEGEVFHLNDQVMPFRRGAGTMALRAARRSNRPVACVPCGMKFVYVDDPTPKLSAVMDRLEQHLGLTPRREMSLARRLERFMDGVLCLKELEILGASQTGSAAERIQRLIDTVLGRLEDRYAVVNGHGSVPERVKRLRQRVISHREASPFDCGQLKRLDDDMNQLFLVMQLFSYPADYLTRVPSNERLAETIDKLEEDVLGVRTAGRRGLRRAVVEFGEPIVVAPSAYAKTDVAELTSAMQTQVQRLLDGMNQPQTPSVVPDSVPLTLFFPAFLDSTFTSEPALAN